MNEKILRFIIGRYEDKLLELLPKKEVFPFFVEVAKEAFRMEIEDMEDCDFKQYVIENFDAVTESGELPDKE